MFIKSLVPLVSARTRAKGANYFRSGSVIAIGGGEWSAHATVRGTRDYRIELRRESGTDRFTASCECPYYADRGEICKHIWAALLEADRVGLLEGEGQPLQTATIEPEYRMPTDDPHPDPAPPAGAARAAARPAWERFLAELQQDVAATERAHPAPRFSNGELVYAIDVRDTLILYEYGVAGVVYTASQDVSSLGPFLPADPMSIIGPATIKFDRRNPANSMVVCERWSGLGSRSPLPTDVVSQANSR